MVNKTEAQIQIITREIDYTYKAFGKDIMNGWN
jgi:hypothetical protein